MRFIKKFLVKIACFIINKFVEGEGTFNASSAMVDKQFLFLQNVSKLIQFVETLPGYQVTGGELFRTPEQQAIYVAKGLSKTNNSKHLRRLAIDLNLFIDGVYKTDNASYKPLADYWKTLHPQNDAGYFWGWDGNHFEMK